MQPKSRIAATIGLMSCCVAVLTLSARAASAQSATDKKAPTPTKARVLFLHHSTGECVWNGGVKAWFDAYNKANKTEYEITEQIFPKSEPYGWNNYPYDYWNIWVRHAGDRPYSTEPTLEMLTPKYDVIVFKHCFPVSAIEADTGNPDITSEDKRIENYKLQYAALKAKLHEFPKTKFIVWTGAALVEGETDEGSARRAKEFFDWVRRTWESSGDNIYLWDFRALETEGGLYLKPAYASGDSHPNERFSKAVAPLFCQRIVDVIHGIGDAGSITGKGQQPPIATQPATLAIARGGPAPTGTQPTAMLGPGVWLFDNAEDPARERLIWGEGATYAQDGNDRVIKIRFDAGREEDWGEYGIQKIVTTAYPTKNHDVAQHRYLAFRARVDREMELVLTLITKPDTLPRADESYVGFTAYLHPNAGSWEWIVLDLTKLEIGVEGEKAYVAAGKPTRCESLTGFRFVTSKQHENADVAIDDIAFYRVLPESLANKVQTP